MASLLPEVLDVRQVSRDVDRVSLRLTEEGVPKSLMTYRPDG